ncbi:MAG: hypothetical protein J6Y37_00125, partial [Paludibacteraceae bacterium]|nr:hypothetical protein [Paludibacteraceae bacterium]
YNYNLGGQLSSVVGEKKYLYKYIDTIGYDMYEQRSYIKYGNGVETSYGYSTNRRRLASLDVVSPKYEGKIMANAYSYDEMDNIIRLENNVAAKNAGNKTIGGYTSHHYDYDKWGRLYKAEGGFNAGAKKAHYNLNMSYDKLYNVTSKKLDLTQENLQFEGSMSVGHELTYQYDEKNPFKLLNVNVKEYATDSMKADTLQRINMYDFDANGNQTMASVALVKDSSCLADTAGQQVRQLLWDEDNRLLAINDNGFVSNYFYDSNGERTVKLSQPDMAVFVNGASALKNDSSLMKFVGYVSPYLVVSNGGRYTKHIYAGTQRIASKLGDIEAFGADPRRVEKAGADIRDIDFGKKYAEQNDSLSSRYDQLGAMNKPEQNDDYVGGQSFCCGDKSLAEMPQNAETSENAQFEDNIYFYHPDHLGSTSMVTNIDGEITQNVVYIPYGEVFVEERNGTWASPYLFNAKELDEETGLYYYGARYLDPNSTRWLSVDPMWEKYVGMTPYNYCAGNPVIYVDPDGKEKHILYPDITPPSKKSVENYAETIKWNRLQERNALNKSLTNDAQNFSVAENVIGIFAHGVTNGKKGLGIEISTGERSTTTEWMKKYLEDNSLRWNADIKDKKKSIIFLFACATGKGEDSYAQRVSKDLNCVVIAPNETIVSLTRDGKQEKPKVYGEGTLFNTAGDWSVFYDGKLVDQMPGYDGFFSKAIDIEKFIGNLNVNNFLKELSVKFNEQNK